MDSNNALMAGNFGPDTPTMLRFPTFPRLRRSKSVRPTTPTFLSEPDAPPSTKPVVYSPVPTYTRTQSELCGGFGSSGFPAYH